MIEMSIRVDGDLTAYLQGAIDRLGNLQPLGHEIATIIEAGNRQGLLAGLDADGVPMAPVKRRWGGEPLVPHESGSRAITLFEAIVEPGPHTVGILAEWEAQPWLRFHDTGTRTMPRRHITGIRPDTWNEIMSHIDNFKDTIFNGTQ